MPASSWTPPQVFGGESLLGDLSTLAKQLRMNSCDVPHVVADPVLFRRHGDVLPSQLLIPLHLVIKPEIQILKTMRTFLLI